MNLNFHLMKNSILNATRQLRLLMKIFNHL